MRPAIQAVTAASIAAGLARVRESIPAHVQIVAAVKYVDAAACALLVQAGIVDLAENRFDQLVAKQDAGVIDPSVRWHFIGRLQSRESVAVAGRVDMLHTLCSTSAARRLDAAWQASDAPHASVLVQVNVDGDPAKDGIPAGDVERFLDELPPSIAVAGFMTMPAFATDPELSRPTFSALRELRDTMADRFTGRHPVVELSMGTSQDAVIAADEGATIVRLGRILYGGAE
jgi:pyridoxal phosphate enzyme (YggS family)